MKWPLALLLLFSAGCATSTIESRRTEKISSYQALDPELRDFVDRGQIKIGMPMDAVYIAWGQPDQVLQSEDQSGSATTWLYYGTYLQEQRYWNYREVRFGHRIFLERYLDRDYNPQNYLSAEITFENGVVKRWRMLPRPQ